MNHFIDIQEGDQQTFQQVQPVVHLVQPELQPTAHGIHAVGEPLGKNFIEGLHFGATVHSDHIEVNPIVLFQVRGGKQMLHQPVQINPVGAGYNHQPGRILVIGLIAQIRNHR